MTKTTIASSFTLGDWLHRHGYSQAIYIRSLDRRLGFTPWDSRAPYLPFSGTATTISFVQRYGHRPEGIKGDGHDPEQAGIDPGLFEAGSTAGERGLTASDRLRAAAMLPDNPFGLVDPAGWHPTVQDTMDCIYVRDVIEMSKSFFDGWLTRTLDAAFPQSPPAHPGPPIPKPPVVTPPSPPVVPPAGVQGLPPLTPAAARVPEIEARVLKCLSRVLPVNGPLGIGVIGPALRAILPLARPVTVELLKAYRITGDPRPSPPGDS